MGYLPLLSMHESLACPSNSQKQQKIWNETQSRFEKHRTFEWGKQLYFIPSNKSLLAAVTSDIYWQTPLHILITEN